MHGANMKLLAPLLGYFRSLDIYKKIFKDFVPNKILFSKCLSGNVMYCRLRVDQREMIIDVKCS